MAMLPSSYKHIFWNLVATFMPSLFLEKCYRIWYSSQSLPGFFCMLVLISKPVSIYFLKCTQASPVLRFGILLLPHYWSILVDFKIPVNSEVHCSRRCSHCVQVFICALVLDLSVYLHSSYLKQSPGHLEAVSSSLVIFVNGSNDYRVFSA